MPDGLSSPEKRRWLVSDLKAGSLIAIDRPGQTKVTLTILATPRTTPSGKMVALRDNQGVYIYMPMGATIQPVPGVLLYARRSMTVAISSDDRAWVLISAPASPSREPTPA